TARTAEMDRVARLGGGAAFFAGRLPLTTTLFGVIVSPKKAMTGKTPCFRPTERERHRLKAFPGHGQRITTSEPPTDPAVG
ncbi:hypothetical protein, partial [Pseudoflavonifractor phocaeensis]|uniref:hypothetical protein n=1 Tax=Pseudoflavonifractor phocaeensis TaxID=1870988 RepID=UPI00210B5409